MVYVLLMATRRALLLGNFERWQRLQELMGSHGYRHQALDQVHDRVRAALLAQEIVRVVDDSRCLVRLHVVAVDDPLQRAAA